MRIYPLTLGFKIIDGAVAVAEETWKSGKMYCTMHNCFALFIYADCNQYSLIPDLEEASSNGSAELYYIENFQKIIFLFSDILRCFA